MTTRITDLLLSDQARKITAMQAMYTDFEREVEQLVSEKERATKRIMPQDTTTDFPRKHGGAL